MKTKTKKRKRRTNTDVTSNKERKDRNGGFRFYFVTAECLNKQPLTIECMSSEFNAYFPNKKIMANNVLKV